MHLSASDLFCVQTELAHQLLLQGQQKLIDRELEQGLTYFEQACELKPQDPKVYFEQGLSLLEFGSEEGRQQALLLACRKFKKAIFLLPEYFDGWYLWGVALLTLGQVHREHHYFCEADRKLAKALELSEGKDAQTLSEFYHHYGKAKAELASHSQEAHDWQVAVSAYDKASRFFQIVDPEFWNQFGLCALALAKVISDVKLCVKAVHCFKHAVSHSLYHYEGWKNLAYSLRFLYECTHDEDHFAQACDCFSAGVRIYPLKASLWLDWAQLLCRGAHKSLDPKRARDAIEKSSRAYGLDASLVSALACWGESLALLGQLTDHIELIHEGQNKLSLAVEKSAGDPQIWRALGQSFMSLAHYFDEEDLYFQAIEKFQQGASLDRTCHELWYGIASCYFCIGKSFADATLLEKALYFYRKSIDLYPRSSYYHAGYAYCLSVVGEVTLEEKWLEQAVREFEWTFQMQKNALYLHPDWLFQYARTLDLYAEFFEEESYYHKAIEIYSHVLMIDPDFPLIHYQLALVYSHLGELLGEIEQFYRSLHYFKLALKHDGENDQIFVDLGVTLINIAEHSYDTSEKDTCYKDAESKLLQAARGGNLQAYYQLACLCSLLKQPERSLSFLMKAESFDALPSMEDLLEDDWLSYARCYGAFQEFLSFLERKSGLPRER